MTKLTEHAVAIVVAAMALIYFFLPALMGISSLLLGILALPYVKAIAGVMLGVALYQVGKKALNSNRS